MSGRRFPGEVRTAATGGSEARNEPRKNDGAREAFLRAAGWTAADGPDRRSPYDRAADLVAEHVDLAALSLPA